MPRYEIELEEGALRDLKGAPAAMRARIVDAIEVSLSSQPPTPSRNRKELPSLVPSFHHVPPVWELRVEDWRVFYDVDRQARVVYVRAVRRKGRSTTEEVP